MSELAFMTGLELAQKIKAREVSSVELTQMFIDRIEQHDAEINAVVVRLFDEALDAAAEADAALARGEDLGPLHGLPMTIKESYVIAGTPATYGYESFADNFSDHDGLAVARFKAAGAHFLGKTNVPVGLADFQSYNPIYGQTNNPYDYSRIPGGSSGGSAAALAAGFCGLEAGSDIGGSIRNPAHFCGVYGHKPTYGIVPTQGHELVEGLPDADLSVCGPMARGARDLEVALDIMAGPIAREGVGWKLDLPGADFTDLKDLRVAIWPTDDIAPVSAGTVARAELVGSTLSRLGATVSDTARPDFVCEHAHRNYQTLLQSVLSSGMTQAQIDTAQGIVDGLDPQDQSYKAVLARASVISHRDWIASNNEREALRRAWDDFFAEWDILICPQMAVPAFPHDHRKFGERETLVDNVAQPYFQQLFWAGIVINAYLPSTVFPTGLDKEGLPLGLQAVSAPYRDKRCIEFAHQISREIGGFTAPGELR
ncbi:MAG: amidase [Pseudomonadota bacterium]